MRLSDKKRLQSLLEKRTDLDEAIKKLQVKAAREQKQKLDKQGKLLGRAILEQVSNGQAVSFSSEEEIKAFMDDHLVLKTERSAFDLPELDSQKTKVSGKEKSKKTSGHNVTTKQPEIATDTVSKDLNSRKQKSTDFDSIPDSKTLEDQARLRAVETVVSPSQNEQKLKPKPNVLTPLPMTNTQDELAGEFFLDEDYSTASTEGL